MAKNNMNGLHRLVRLLLLIFYMPTIYSGETFIDIILQPRDWQDPREADGFLCGINDDIDSSRLLAEQNAAYLFQQWQRDQARVIDVLAFGQNEEPDWLLDEAQGFMREKDNVLFTLFTAPRTNQCNSRTFYDMKFEKFGYYPVFMGDSSDLTDVTERFISDAHSFKVYYDDKLPKLCASVSMNTKNSTAKKEEETFLFNFLYNSKDRSVDAEKWKICETANATLNSLAKSKKFNINDGLEFEQLTQTVHESDGFARVQILRKSHFNQKTVGIVATDFDATENDVAPLYTAVVFNESETKASVVLRLIEDNEEEEPEKISLYLIEPENENMNQQMDVTILSKARDGSSGCGYNSVIDSERMLAELNAAFLMEMMDNSEDKNPKYRTVVNEALRWKELMNNPLNLVHELPDIRTSLMESGYYLLFLAPTTVPCSESVFKGLNLYIPISCDTFTDLRLDVEQKLISLTNSLPMSVDWVRNLYEDSLPKVCVAFQNASLLVANSRKQTMHSLFNFALESGRAFSTLNPTENAMCSQPQMTEAIIKTILAEASDDILVNEDQIEVFEWEGSAQIHIKKASPNHEQKSVIFLETIEGTAQFNDFVKYSGPLVFERGQTSATISIQIKLDQEEEPDENFSLVIRRLAKKRNKRAPANIEIQLMQINKNIPVRTEGEWNQQTSCCQLTPDERARSALTNRMRHAFKINSVPGFDGQCDRKAFWRQRHQNLPYWPIKERSDQLRIEIIDSHDANLISINNNDHNVVQFRSQLSRMKITGDEWINKNQMTLSPGPTSSEHIYLPWMKNTITFIQISGLNVKEAFTAQLSGCGIRLFRMNGEVYLSHDNGIDLHFCPSMDQFRHRFLALGIINNLNDIQFISEVMPNGPNADYRTHEERTNLQIFPDVQPTTLYNNYILRASVSAIEIGNQWCLALQRSTVVYDGRSLTFHERNERQISVNNRNEFYNLPHEQILFARNVNGNPGFEIKCQVDHYLVHLDRDPYESSALTWFNMRIINVRIRIQTEPWILAYGLFAL